VHRSRRVPPWFLVVVHASLKINCLRAVYDLIYSSCDSEDAKKIVLSLGGKTLFIFFQEVLDSSVLNWQTKKKGQPYSPPTTTKPDVLCITVIT